VRRNTFAFALTRVRLRAAAPRVKIKVIFDCNSTALRPHVDLHHNQAAALRPKSINRSAWLRLAGYITVTLMTFWMDVERPSIGRQIEVNS